MRNGNYILFYCFLKPIISLKPTYEEWKLSSPHSVILIDTCLKPTYEEWKRADQSWDQVIG